jgi:hypothetical protein
MMGREQSAGQMEKLWNLYGQIEKHQHGLRIQLRKLAGDAVTSPRDPYQP